MAIAQNGDAANTAQAAAEEKAASLKDQLRELLSSCNADLERSMDALSVLTPKNQGSGASKCATTILATTSAGNSDESGRKDIAAPAKETSLVASASAAPSRAPAMDEAAATPAAAAENEIVVEEPTAEESEASENAFEAEERRLMEEAAAKVEAARRAEEEELARCAAELVRRANQNVLIRTTRMVGQAIAIGSRTGHASSLFQCFDSPL